MSTARVSACRTTAPTVSAQPRPCGAALRRWTVSRPSRQRSRPACISSPPRSAICATSPCARWKRSPRADLIACEDTRVTRKLLDHYGIATPLTPYHEHNAAQARPKLLARLAEGRRGRAGLGCRHAADFRSRLQARARGARGRHARHRAARAPRRCWPRSRVAALPTDRFFFEGFLPAKEGQRRSAHRRARAHSGDAGAVRDRAAHRRGARRSRRRARDRARPRSAAS